jgi:hypothetical protein
MDITLFCRDKAGVSKRSAFVKYFYKKSADKAIAELNEKV